jgi:hypothetical protein
MSTQRRVVLALAILAIVVGAVLVLRRPSDDTSATAPSPTTADGSGGSTTSSVSPGTVDPSSSVIGDGTTAVTAPTTATPPSTAPGPPETPPSLVVPADDLNPPVKISVTPTNGLHNLSEVTVHVQANPGSSIFSVEAKQCRAEPRVTVSAEFVPSGGRCAPNELAPGADKDVKTITPPPNTSADVTFKVGVGSATWPAKYGPGSISCGPGAPCTLVLELEVPQATDFYSIPISFA